MVRRNGLVIPAGYEVTDCGRVVSFVRGAPRELRQYVNGSGYGYPSVFLVFPNKPRKHYAVYRLVAAVYLPRRPFADAVPMHLDGDRMNSRASNLAWGTQSQNVRHAYAQFWDRRSAEDMRKPLREGLHGI